jgi:hypothetical protein
MRSTSWFAALVLLALPAGARAEGALHLGQKEFQPATVERIGEMVQSAVHETSLPDALEVEKPADPKMVSIWEGNKPLITNELRRITLFFGPEEKPGTVRPQLLPMVLTLEKDAVVLPHAATSHSMRKEDNPGRIAEGTKKLMGLAVGSGYTAFMLSVPKTESNNSRAVLICARPKAGEQLLKFWGAKYEGVSHASAKLLSGLGTGVARVTVQTSATMAPPREWTDHSIGSDPAIIFDYAPVISFTPETKHQIEQQVGAIETALELKNAAGYRRITTVSDIATVQGVTLEAEQAGQLMNQEYSGGPLPCYVLGIDHRKSESYDQQAPKQQPTPDAEDE